MKTPIPLAQALTGVVAVLVTPYRSDGTVDDHLTEHIAGQVDRAGVHALTSLGNTAEVHQLTESERRQHLRAVAGAREGAAIIAGAAGAASAVLQQIEFAAGLGFDAAMVHEPPDPFGDDDGFAQYFGTIAERSALPVVAYLRSGRIGGAGVAQIVEHPNVVGVKYAARDLEPLRSAMARTPDACTWVNGAAEGRAPEFLPLGITGFTSGIANARPDLALAVHDALVTGNEPRLTELVQLLAPIEDIRSMSGNKFNVSVLKAMFAKVGVDMGGVRPPHSALTAEASTRLDAALASLP